MAETKKFVDLTGLDYFWSKVEPIITDGDAAAKTYAENKATDALNTAKTYVDGKVDGKFDTVGSAAQALADAKTYFNTENAKDATRMLAIEGDVDALEATVGDTTSGLVQEVAALRAEMNALGGIDGGDGIGGMIDAKIGALDVEDAAVEGQYVSSVSEVDGKITVARVALPNYTADFAAKANASDLTAHTGDTVAHITAAERTAWNNAEQNAKDYADGLASNYDAAGAAAQALVDAKAYTDGKVDGKFDAAGAAATVQGNLDVHTGDAVAHITADERTAWNTAKASIDAFLKDADMTADAVDTLKELQTYMTTDGAAAAELVGRVGALETADETIRGEFATADAQVLADAKADATTKADAAKADAIAAAATDATTKADAALAAAKADAAELYQVKGSYEAAGAAAAALDAAKADATSKANAAQAAAEATAAADATTKANAAQAAAQSYADGLATNYDAAGAASAAETAAKKYTDDTIAAFEFASEDDINALFA